MKPVRKIKSPKIQKLLDEMNNDPWYVKFRRWVKLKIWIIKCSLRKYYE